MADNNQQYMWRQRRKRNARITVWLILVICAAAIATFVYEGMKDSNPQKVAERYVKEKAGVDEFSVKAGNRSLSSANQFVQDYTFTYTADGSEVEKRVSLVQQNEKKYGLFDQWTVQPETVNYVDVQLIAPVGVQVLVDGVAPTDADVQTVDGLSPGAVCYQLSVDDMGGKLQVNGLPFESYEGTVLTGEETVDVRSALEVSENAKVQMEEMGKDMLNELFTAVVSGKQASDLGSLFDQIPDKEDLFQRLSENLTEDGTPRVSSISFEKITPEFGGIYYPGNDEEPYVGMEMKLSYTCSFKSADDADEADETDEAASGDESASGGETEDGTEEESGTEPETSVEKEAVFFFRYQDGACTVSSVKVPGIL